MVEVLRVGYCLPFLSTPPLSTAPIPMPSYSPTSIKGASLEEVTLGLVVKGAVELAPLPSPGFYSPVPLIVDFLIHLRRDKGLSVFAVKGYRYALNSVFALKGIDLVDSCPISMLLGM